ncbi:MAG: hypothetical protein Q9227_002680 [Pyrenula ochraceoflavens]
MVSNQIKRMLKEKSVNHNIELERLGKQVKDEPLSKNVALLEQTPQIKGIRTILRNPATEPVDFNFYLDRFAALLIEKALDNHKFRHTRVKTPEQSKYDGLESAGNVSAVTILRGGSCLETGLKRTIPDCLIGRILIQSNYRTGEPELHYLKLFPKIHTHETVMLLDSQMSSGGAALMAVRVLVDHGVQESNIVFVTCLAGKMGVNRMMSVFPDMKVVVGRLVDDQEERWIEQRYFGC